MLTWMTSLIPSRGLGVTRIMIGAATVIRSLVTWPILLGLTDPEVFQIVTPPNHLIACPADWLRRPTSVEQLQYEPWMRRIGEKVWTGQRPRGKKHPLPLRPSSGSNRPP